METVAAALAADVYPERRAFILNGIQIAFGVGAAAGPSIAHTALTAGIAWHALYLGLAVLTLALVLFLTVQRVPRADTGAEAVNFSALVTVLRQPFFLLLCGANVLYVAAETGFFSWMPTYFSRSLPGGAAWAGMVVTVFWIAMTIGRTATGVILHRLPLLRLIFLFAIGGALGSSLALVWQSPLVVQCFIAWTGLCFAGIFGLIMAEAGERYTAIAGTAFGGVVAAGGIGGALGPWLVGVLGETALGWRGALAVIPALMIGLTAVTLKLMRSARHR
jgi:FHS family glucose/mannose:H+ symporter-like MFS transporter